MTESISTARKKLLSGEISVSQLVGAAQHQARVTQEYGAFLEVFPISQEEIDVAQKNIDTLKEESPVLTGIPIAVKDNILIKGRKVSAASKMLEDHIASYDATVITKLKEAGALIIGRTNMDEFAMGSSTEHSAFQKTLNPHDKGRVPGGTSGGSAAAVGLGVVPAALGTETGGSIRQPAAFCGIVGLKPTYGSVSRNGVIAHGSSLDQVSPCGKTLEDVEQLYRVTVGADPLDSTSREGAAPSVPKKMRIGVPRHLLTEGVDTDLMDLFDAQLEQLIKDGHEVIDITLPTLEYGIPMYYIITAAEASTNLARYDGIRYGHHSEGATWNDIMTNTRTEGFGAEVRRRILLGTYVLSSGYIDAYYRTAQKAREILTEEISQQFASVDIIALPTTPTPAFKFGENASPVQMYQQDIFTVPASLTGHPAISVPMGTVEREGVSLPIGMQFIGPHFGEDRLFTIGKEIRGEGILK